MSTTQFLAYNEFPADGVQTEWDFNFTGVAPDNNSGTTPYLYPSDVRVDMAFTNTLGETTVTARDIELIAPNRVKVLGAVIPAGYVVRIYRATEARFPLVDYRDRQTVTEADLDLQSRQTLFVAAEALDRASRTVEITEGAVSDIRNTAAHAVRVAEGVDAKATTALDRSTSAVLIAQRAETTANGVDGKATRAEQDAANALSTANSINGKAEEALNTSSQAISTANLAAAQATANDPRQFGLGAQKVTTNSDCNSYLTAGSFIMPTVIQNGPPGWSADRTIMVVAGGSAYAIQTLKCPRLHGRSAERTWDGVRWTDWRAVGYEGSAHRNDYSGASASLRPADAGLSIVSLVAGQNTSVSVPTSNLLPDVLTLKVLYVQPSSGAGTVTHPSGTTVAQGQTLVSNLSRSMSLVEYMSFDRGATYLARNLGVFIPELPAGPFPVPSGLNAVFNNEGTASGWTSSNMNLTESGGILRGVKVTAAGGENGQFSWPVSLPSTDYILYVRMRSDAGYVCWLENSAQSRLVILWLNSAAGSGAPAAGNVNLTGYTSSGPNNAALSAGGNTTDWIDVALHHDRKFQTVTAYYRRGDGGWIYRGRVNADNTTLDRLVFRSTSSAPAGSFVEVDFVSICKPNIVVVGDSIAEGKNGFSPNPALGLTNYTTTWAYHATLYPQLRNNLVVNKGVGGNTGAQTLARSSEYTTLGAEIVVLHASTNDMAGSVPQATRTSQHQSIINAIKASGAKVVLFNAMYGTVNNTTNPGQRNYMHQWWTEGRLSLSGVDFTVDIMQPIRDSNNYMATSATESDAIHPNLNGHTAIGTYIKSFT